MDESRAFGIVKQEGFGVFGINGSAFVMGMLRFRGVVESVRVLILAKYEAGKIESATEGHGTVRRMERESILKALNESYAKHGYVLLKMPTVSPTATYEGVKLKINDEEFNGKGEGYTVVAGTPISRTKAVTPGSKKHPVVYQRGQYHNDVYAEEEFLAQMEESKEDPLSGYFEAHALVNSVAMRSEMPLHSQFTESLRLIQRILKWEPETRSTRYIVRVREETVSVTITEQLGFGTCETKHGLLTVSKKPTGVIYFNVSYHSVWVNPTDTPKAVSISSTLDGRSYSQKIATYQLTPLITNIIQYPEGGVTVGKDLQLNTVTTASGALECSNLAGQVLTVEKLIPKHLSGNQVQVTAWDGDVITGMLFGPDVQPDEDSFSVKHVKVGVFEMQGCFECKESKLYRNTENVEDARRKLQDYIHTEFGGVLPLETFRELECETYTLLPTPATSYPNSTPHQLPLLLQFGANISASADSKFQWSVGGACGIKIDVLEAVVAYAHTQDPRINIHTIVKPTAQAFLEDGGK
jgi:hypothetical protein